MSQTDIEWTDRAWPIVNGCEKVSPGCKHCWALRLTATRLRHHGRYKGLAVYGEHGPQWTGERRLALDIIDEPLRIKTPQKWFVANKGDLFSDEVNDITIAGIFGIMAACPQHTFQILTKRAERMARWFNWIAPGGFFRAAVLHEGVKGLMGYSHPKRPAINHAEWPLPNVWIGVSAEDQVRYDERAAYLREVPAAVRFLSLEPLLGGIDLRLTAGAPHVTRAADGTLGISGPLHWAIVGGESGHDARPMHPAWVRSLRDQCAAAGVRFFFKQWGEWQNGSTTFDSRFKKLSPKQAAKLNRVVLTNGDAIVDSLPAIEEYLRAKGITSMEYGRMRPTMMAKVGKGHAGALLDDRMHREWPEVAT